MSEIWNMEFMSQIKKQIFMTQNKIFLVANIYHHYDRDES